MAFPYWNARPSARPSNRSKSRRKNRLAVKLEQLEGRELLSGVPAMHGAGGGAGLTGVSDYNLPGNFQFAAPSYSVNENGAFATFKVTRTFGSTGAVSVDYSTGGGTAVAGVNYVATAGTLSWADGDSTPKTFQVQILDDQVVASNKTLQLSLSMPSGGASIGAQGTTALTIVNTDGPVGSLQFTHGGIAVLENAGQAVIAVSRVGGSNGAITVQYSATAGTAVAGVDFTPVQGTLSWAAGDGSVKTFTVPVFNDNLPGPNKNVKLTLSNPTGGAVLGGQSNAWLLILEVSGTINPGGDGGAGTGAGTPTGGVNPPAGNPSPPPPTAPITPPPSGNVVISTFSKPAGSPTNPPSGGIGAKLLPGAVDSIFSQLHEM